MYVSDLMNAAAVVVVAEVIDGGAAGQLTLRPLDVLKGDLPADADGLLHIEWTAPVGNTAGIWVLDADGRPLDLTEGGLDPSRFGYPWRMNDYFVVYAVEETFPSAVLAEARRVVAAADVVVSVTWSDSMTPTLTGEEVAVVEEVLRGQDLTAGDALSFRYNGVPVPADFYYWQWSVVFALKKVDLGWQTVPTWLYPGWDCGDLPLLAVYEAFADFRIHETAGAGECSR